MIYVKILEPSPDWINVLTNDNLFAENFNGDDGYRYIKYYNLPDKEDFQYEELTEEEYMLHRPPEPVIEEQVEDKKKQKLMELSSKCQEEIHNGLDITLSNNEIEHFSFKEEDQINLSEIYSKINSNEDLNEFAYHQDGHISKFYSRIDMKHIIETLMEFKNLQLNYYNALKMWILGMQDEEFNNIYEEIYFGMDIPDEYEGEVLKSLLESNT